MEILIYIFNKYPLPLISYYILKSLIFYFDIILCTN